MLGSPQRQQYGFARPGGSRESAAYPSSIIPDDWHSRLDAYGDAVARLSITYPAEISYGGRNDIAAQLAQGLSKRNKDRADKKATKDMQEGKNGGIDQRRAKAKWVCVCSTSRYN